VRILSSASTATLAAQPSAQTALGGDSFAVILSAASEEPVSAPALTGVTAKSQSGQGSSGRGSGKQTEVKAPPVEGNRSQRTNTSRSSNHQTDSQFDEASSDQKFVNPPTGRSTSVATGRNLSATLNFTSLQSSSPSFAATTAASTPFIAARTTWTAGAFQAQSAGASLFPKSTDGDTRSASQAQTDGRTLNRRASDPSVPQLPANDETRNSVGAAALPQPIQLSAFDAEKSPEQKTGQPSDNGASAAPVRTADVPVATASHDLPQPPATRPVSNTATPEAASASTADIAVAPASHNVPQSPATQSTSNAAAPMHDQLPQDARTSANQSTSLVAPQERNQSSRNPQSSAAPMDSTVDADSSAPATPNGLPTPVAASVESAAAVMLQQSIALPVPTMTLPNSAFVSSKGTGLEAVSNTTQKADSSAAKPANSDLANAANSGTGKTKDDAPASPDAPAHNLQSAQSDPSQTAASTPKGQDIAASHPQAQTVASSAGTHETTIAPRPADASVSAFHPGAERAPGAAADPEIAEAMPMSGVSAAKLVQAMSESEMHIGLSSSSFGDISIRTSVTNHQMLAQISLDHSELSQAISAHVSSVQAKLSDDYGLRANIQVNNLPSSHSDEPGNPSQRERGTAAASLAGESVAVEGEEISGMGQEVFASAGNASRLDIRA
jgi:hypothetical protein